MPSLRLFTSNRLEILAKALSETLETPLPSPLDQEVIIVQSKGMERWVATELARYHGICSNVRFPFPNAFLHDVFRKRLQEHFPDESFSKEVMTWRVMGLLPSLIMRPGFESLDNYLGDNGSQLKRFQLAERIAHTFDQYVTFRPDMILHWEAGGEDHWQAVLWRALAEGVDRGHGANLGKAFLETLGESSDEIHGFPARISVFGISYMPRFHMEMLAGVSQLTDVTLFLMNPCREYWGDIVSDWEMKRVVDRESSPDMTADALHLQKGNSLLASMGTMGRGFFDVVNEFHCQEIPLFEAPAGDDLLSCLQSDILNLHNAAGWAGEKRCLGEDDDSVQIHACHNPMREMEVLNDQLLHMFEQDPNLTPEDVLVMTPDIEIYAPYIEAVFDVPADENRRFPFNLADRSARKESPVIDAFLSILELHKSRFHASQVMAVLESPVVFERFGLCETDLEIIRTWVAHTGIRWGIDAQSRGKLGLPTLSENTWKAGLERLLLGYAMPGKGEHMFGKILPYDQIEGGEAIILGKFLEFAQRLFAHVTSLEQRRTLQGWSTTLSEIIEAFFLAGEQNVYDMEALRHSVNRLGNMEQSAAFNEEVDIHVIKAYLGRWLEKEGFGFGFMAGGITFCAMLPMRSIPFKVLCLVGMNGGAYPRESRPLGFDLIAQHPRPGDRSRGHDDRYLFLEAILSAREKLYISYVGQSTQDNSLIPPSVLVSELSDYVEQGFEIQGKNVLDHMVTRHRLQAFSPEYFKKDKKLFSYSSVDMEAAQAALRPCHGEKPFIRDSLAPLEDSWKHLTLDDLCRFYRNPTKYLLNKRFGMYLERGAASLEDSESFSLEGLDKYVLEQALVERRFSGKSLREFDVLLRASGQLPHGTVGTCLYENLSRDANRFVEQTEPYVSTGEVEPLEVDLPISDFRITGRLKGRFSERFVQYRYGKVKCKDRISLWIRHLVLNCLKDDGDSGVSILIGLDNRRGKPAWAAWEFRPVHNSREDLERLLHTYWDGLHRPVHLFPESSWTYAQWLLEKDRSQEDAQLAAAKAWAGDEYLRGERDDPYYQSCFGETDVLGEEFRETAVQVFSPLMASQKEIKG